MHLTTNQFLPGCWRAMVSVSLLTWPTGRHRSPAPSWAAQSESRCSRKYQFYHSHHWWEKARNFVWIIANLKVTIIFYGYIIFPWIGPTMQNFVPPSITLTIRSQPCTISAIQYNYIILSENDVTKKNCHSTIPNGYNNATTLAEPPTHLHATMIGLFPVDICALMTSLLSWSMDLLDGWSPSSFHSMWWNRVTESFSEFWNRHKIWKMDITFEANNY